MPEHLIGNQNDLEAALKAGKSRLRLRDGAAIRYDAPGDTTIVVDGPVRADLQFVASASPTIICSGRARVEVTFVEQSQPRIRFSGASDVVAKCHGISSPIFEPGEYARLRLDSFDESRPFITATDFASYVLIVHDQAQPRCSGWPSDWLARQSDIYIGQDLHCYQDEQGAVSAARQVYEAFRQTGSRYASCMRVRGAIPRLCRNVVDFRWTGGTVHVELVDEEGGAWYSVDAHHRLPLTEGERSRCTRRPLALPQPGVSPVEGEV